jgi:hypothetical protein
MMSPSVATKANGSPCIASTASASFHGELACKRVRRGTTDGRVLRVGDQAEAEQRPRVGRALGKGGAGEAGEARHQGAGAGGSLRGHQFRPPA